MSVGELGNMDKAVLVDADIDKSAEVDDIAYGALQFHARFQVLHFQHVSAQQGRGQLVAGVAAGFHQLARDVAERGLANAKFFGEGGVSKRFGLLGQRPQPAGCRVGKGEAAAGEEAFCGLVRFRVDAGIV